MQLNILLLQLSITALKMGGILVQMVHLYKAVKLDGKHPSPKNYDYTSEPFHYLAERKPVSKNPAVPMSFAKWWMNALFIIIV